MNLRAGIVLEDPLSYKMFHRSSTLVVSVSASQSGQDVNFENCIAGEAKVQYSIQDKLLWCVVPGRRRCVWVAKSANFVFQAY